MSWNWVRIILSFFASDRKDSRLDFEAINSGWRTLYEEIQKDMEAVKKRADECEQDRRLLHDEVSELRERVRKLEDEEDDQ